MTKECYLIGEVEGTEYDKRIKLTYVTDVETTLLFDYWAYRLFDNQNNEVWVNLNFGEEQFIPHAVMQIGSQIVFVPRFSNLESPYQTNGLLELNWREYLAKVAPQIFIIHQEDWKEVWASVNISLEGLSNITTATSEDIFLLWLISSNFCPSDTHATLTPDYANALAKSILAEDPEHNPSIKDVLQMILNRDRVLDVSSVEKATSGDTLTAYLLNEDGSMKDWPAVFVSDNNQVNVLLAGLRIKLVDGN